MVSGPEGAFFFFVFLGLLKPQETHRTAVGFAGRNPTLPVVRYTYRGVVVEEYFTSTIPFLALVF